MIVFFTIPISSISSEERNAFVPSVKISLGGVVSFIAAETEAYKFSDNNYIYNYGGSSYFFNWLSPTINAMVLFTPENKFCFGFGGNFTIALYGLFFTKTTLNHTHPVTGGSIAPYGIIGYDNFILHIGYDFGTGSLYLAPQYIINKHFMIGIQMSPFANNHQGLYSILLPPKERVNPPNPYWEDNFFQIGLSFQYIF
ncbi:hypothetical protein R84B8_01708 [Treponema sp. R8-4-B8]